MADYKNLSDSELLRLLKASDHAAFTEVYSRYYYMIFREAFRKLGDEDHTKDIVQEQFVNLWDKRENANNINNLPGYLITALKYRIINFFEHQSVKSKYIEYLTGVANTGNIAHSDYLAREREWQRYIEEAIDSMPGKMRFIFNLSRKENLSNIEIAKKLNTSESNISHHLSNATKLLKTKLGEIF